MCLIFDVVVFQGRLSRLVVVVMMMMMIFHVLFNEFQGKDQGKNGGWPYSFLEMAYRILGYRQSICLRSRWWLALNAVGVMPVTCRNWFDRCCELLYPRRKAISLRVSSS